MRSRSPIADAFDAVLADRANEVLLVAPSEARTYTARQIDDTAIDLATACRRVGLGRGHLVLACLGNVAAMPSLVLACLREGLPLLPVDRSTPAAEVRALADTRQAAAVIVPASLDLDAVGVPGVGGIGRAGTAGSGQAGTAGPTESGARRTRVSFPVDLAAYVLDARPDAGAHAPAALLRLTSGSTGAPRATCTEERHLLADVRHIVDAMGIGPRDRQLGVIPLSHAYGFGNLLLPLLWQGTALWLRPQFVPTQVGPDIHDGRLTTFAGVPFMFEHLARHQPSPALGALRLVLSAGARLPFSTVQAFHDVAGVKVRSFYGSSETGGICFDGTDALDARVPVGQPIGEVAVTLVEDDDAPDGAGRVQVHGPNVMDRYMSPPDGVEAMEADTAAPTSAFVAPATFLTGDYASRDATGVHVLVGRVASYVNVAGRKVHPREIEAALRGLPGVTDAVALPVDDPLRGQALGACVASTHPWDARTVREALSSQLAAWKLPRVLVVLPALPLTERGKIDRIAIARRLGQA